MYATKRPFGTRLTAAGGVLPAGQRRVAAVIGARALLSGAKRRAGLGRGAGAAATERCLLRRHHSHCTVNTQQPTLSGRLFQRLRKVISALRTVL